MKTVTGEIVSSNPISPAKAAYILSAFVSQETGASQAVRAYLRRATSAFDELLRAHAKSDPRMRKKRSKESLEPESEEVKRKKKRRKYAE